MRDESRMRVKNNKFLIIYSCLYKFHVNKTFRRTFCNRDGDRKVGLTVEVI